MKVIGYNQFLNETRGYPQIIDGYFRIIYEKCNKEIDFYLNTKGNFFNYNKYILIEYNDIKKYIKEDDFKIFPIEKIAIYFRINLNKNIVDPISYDSSYHTLYNNTNNNDEQSLRIKSKSDIVDESIFLRITIQILINKQSSSIDISNLKKLTEINIKHELTHSYQDYKNILKTTYNDVNFLFKSNNLYDKSDSLNIFFHLIYSIDNVEIAANVSALHNINTLSELKKTDEWLTIKFLTYFDSDYFNNKIIQELREHYNKETVDDFTQNFGIYFIEYFFEPTYKELNMIMNKDLNKLKNKNLLDVLKYWEKIFKRNGEYYKRKLLKNIKSI